LSFWAGDEVICAWRAHPEHLGHPGILYGGVIASVVDCHCIWTAVAYAHRRAGEEIGSSSEHKFVTAAMSLQYRKPVRIEDPIELRARVVDIGDRKAVVRCSVHAAKALVAEAEVVAVRMRTSVVQSSALETTTV
jgi:acyl-coenzyme A thioesterase PaaI-like protein